MVEAGDDLPSKSKEEQLIALARANRERSIQEAAQAFSEADYRRRDESFSGELGRRTIELHMLMEKLDRPSRLRRLLGKQVIKFEQRPKGTGYHIMRTPVLLTTGTEHMVDEFLIRTGYIFETDQCGRTNRHHLHPHIGIDKVWEELITGTTELKRWVYGITVRGEETGHPFASVRHQDPNHEHFGIYPVSHDDPRLEEPLRLVSGAIAVLEAD